MATGSTDAVVTGLGAGTMQYLIPFSLVDGTGKALFSVGLIETGLTAHAGGTQAAALALSASKTVHVVATVGSANDSVVLPAATGSGAVRFVSNQAAANSLQLFAASTETINGVTSATGVAVAAGKSAILVDQAAGKWFMVLSA